MKRSPELTSKIMAKIKSKNTKPELLFGSALFKQGIRFRKHLKVIGKPDFGIKKYKMAIFIDGDFWHGREWLKLGKNCCDIKFEKYSEYWNNKLTNNIKRDIRVNQELRKMRWVVFRFWATEILKDPNKYAKIVYRYMVKNTILKDKTEYQKRYY